MKQVVLNKIRKIAEKSISKASKSNAPRCIVETKIQFTMWSIKQEFIKKLTK